MVDSPKKREAKKAIEIINQINLQMINYPRGGVAEVGINPWQFLQFSDDEFNLLAISVENVSNLTITPSVVKFSWYLKNQNDPILQKYFNQKKITIGFLTDEDLYTYQNEIQKLLEIIDQNNLPLIIYFPKYSDGRAYSQVAILRNNFNFNGKIWAMGDVLIDQVGLMARVGFDGIVPRADQDINLALNQITAFSVQMQDDWRNKRSFYNNNL